GFASSEPKGTMMISTTRRRAVAVTGAGLLAVAVAACESTGGNPQGGGGDGDGGGGGGALTLEQLQERGSITVGFAGEAPYSFEEGGELTGATVALHE